MTTTPAPTTGPDHLFYYRQYAENATNAFEHIERSCADPRITVNAGIGWAILALAAAITEE